MACLKCKFAEDLRSQKSKISLLNEMAQKLRFSTKFTDTSKGPDHKKTFICHLKLDKALYVKTGRSKKDARNLVAEQACIAIIREMQSSMFCEKCHAGTFGNNGAMEQNSDQSSSATRGWSPPAKRPRMAPPHDEPSAWLSAPQEPFAERIVQSINMQDKNAMSVINNFAQKHGLTLRYSYLEEGPDHKKTFICNLLVGTQTFSGRANTKKDARLFAAEQAYQMLLGQPVVDTEFISTSLIAIRADLSHGDLMAALSHNKLAELLPSVECSPGKKVIAAFIMASPGSPLKVVSLGSGTKCVGGDALSLTGTTVNDCHAEIVARRALKLFLFQEIEQYFRTNTSQLFLKTSRRSNMIRVKPEVEFHLYISAAPCGDGAIFCRSDTNADDSHSDTKEHHPQFSNKMCGQLRTKLEEGEGTIPIRSDTQQTWDGIQKGERLRTMSCSDKIARWNYLGLQGALLSQFMEPIYLSSLTVGSLYKHGHLSRAVCCRLEGLKACSGIYHVNHPRLTTLSQADKLTRSTQKSTILSMNWHEGVKTVEILDATKGTVKDGSVSRLSKSAMFASFAQVCSHVPRMSIPSTYSDAKMKASTYQQAKRLLYDHVAAAGYGTWMQKPEEQEQFEHT